MSYGTIEYGCAKETSKDLFNPSPSFRWDFFDGQVPSGTWLDQSANNRSTSRAMNNR